jgi:hypothetical protein
MEEMRASIIFESSDQPKAHYIPDFLGTPKRGTARHDVVQLEAS